MNDFKINKAVRSILARLRFDTQTVTIRTEHATLIVGGRLQFVNGVDGHRPEPSFELLHEIDRQLRGLEGTKKVEYQFDNWTHNSDGHWTKKQIRSLAGPARSVANRVKRTNLADSI